MKQTFVIVGMFSALLFTALPSHATPAGANLTCKGANLTVKISYVVAITDYPDVQMTVVKNHKTLLQVSTDNENSVNFIQNAFCTPSTVNSDGTIIRYGKCSGPSKLLAFLGEGHEPKLLEVDLFDSVMKIDGVASELDCKSND